ncbi:hypothetical protein evm_005495 [Chilo suppressalis]|nr:hypothetical protein evm_005495 [Chilo suppressalis]
MTTVVNIDYILLSILLILTFFTCGYCVYRVLALHRSGQIELLLRPTRVLFSHKNDGGSSEQLRTVVAYQNPFTGDYCVRKSRVGPAGYVNHLQGPASPDSGLSDEYEPLQLHPQVPQAGIPEGVFAENPGFKASAQDGVYHESPGFKTSILNGVICESPGFKRKPNPTETHGASGALGDNSLNKTWNWNYKEYQI